MKKNLKNTLNKLVNKYETPDFIKDDPIQFPHMYKDRRDIEISGLISSSLAYGRRDKIIESINKIHKIIDFKPYEFAVNFNIKKDLPLFKDFIYRYNQGIDVAILIYVLGQAIKENDSLENLFLKGYSEKDKNIKQALTQFVSTLKYYIPLGYQDLKGVNYLIPSPETGSACKRLNLFLKWMIRPQPVDLYLWQSIPTNKLLIPLDTHVANLSRKLQLTDRKANDWKTAEEITERLKEYDPQDPVKYDFALFGLGVSGESNKIIE